MNINNEKRIRRNRNIGLMRLLDKKNSCVREMLVEHFWPPEDWPDHIVNCLMEFKYPDRLCVCNFFFGNGMQLERAFVVIRFYHTCKISEENAYKYTFTQLWTRVETAVQRTNDNWHHIVSTYYFYSMHTRCVVFFDGHIRLYGSKVNIVNNPNISNGLHIPHRRIEEAAFSNHAPERNNIDQRVIDEHVIDQRSRDRSKRLERRWKFLASIDRDPVIIDGHTFRFDVMLYTNRID